MRRTYLNSSSYEYLLHNNYINPFIHFLKATYLTRSSAAVDLAKLLFNFALFLDWAYASLS